jgi:hypothetical protein
VATSSVAAAAAYSVSAEAAVGGTTNLHHLQLMELLSIDSELSDRSKKGLRWSYKKYKAFNAAVQTVDQIVNQGKWPLAKKPGHTELVEIFMSKSYWHSHVAKPFGTVARYPQMVAWLEEEDDLTDFGVWHVQKSEYGFKELKEWLANDGTLDKAAKRRLENTSEKIEKGKKTKGKGKEREREREKGKEKEKEKGKKKETEVDDDEKGKVKASGSKTHKRK